MACGQDNRIEEAGSATIAGGQQNRIEQAGGAAIAGGYQNTISNAGWSVDSIGGGQENRITSAGSATIAGGYQNSISNGAYGATVAGGNHNAVGGGNSVIGGGSYNTALGGNAVIGGGLWNFIGSNTWHSTIPGGSSNEVAASMAFAAGRNAKARHYGSFVWADGQDADFASTAANQFSVRASGGLRFETAGRDATVDGQPLLSGTIVAGQLAGWGSDHHKPRELLGHDSQDGNQCGDQRQDPGRNYHRRGR